MKRRGYIIAVLLVLIISLAGCKPRIWVYDFVEEGSLVRDDEIWRSINDNSYFNAGLILDEDEAGAPHNYIGDFTVTVDFRLNTSSSETAYVELFLASGEDYGSEWAGGMYIPNAGSISSELVIFYRSPSDGLQYPGTVPVASLLFEVGDNSMAIEKVGGVLRFYVNGKLIATSLSVTGYDGETFCPYIGCYSYDPVINECVFKKVTIEYKGDRILID